MSSRLDRFRKARTTASSVFAQIVQLNKKYENPLFCCFEGEDYKYYGIRVESLKQKDYEKIIPLKCGGKQEVTKLYALVSKEITLNFKTFVYFIDRDFDDQIDSSELNIYETPVYSVENFYTSICAFEKILVNELKIEETQSQFEYCMKLFKERQCEFHKGISLLNAWIYCQRKNECPDNKLNLSSFKINTLISSFTLQKVDFIGYDLEYLEGCFENSVKISENELLNAKVYLDESPQELYRGKFELEFLYNFITKLTQSINIKESPFEGTTKVGFNISKVNLMSEISQYAKTSECLKTYIRKSA